MDDRMHRTTSRAAGRAPARRPSRADPAPGPGAWTLAVLGLLAGAGLGVTMVATVLAEATPDEVAPATAERAPVDPGLLRVWGLRTSGGGLAPLASTDPVPATPLEELYATLRPAR